MIPNLNTQNLYLQADDRRCTTYYLELHLMATFHDYYIRCGQCRWSSYPHWVWPKLFSHFCHTWVQGQHVVHEAHGVGGGVVPGHQDHHSGCDDVGLVVAPLAALVLDLDVINGLFNW